MTVFQISVYGVVASVLSVGHLMGHDFFTTIGRLVNSFSQGARGVFLSFADRRREPVHRALFGGHGVYGFF